MVSFIHAVIQKISRFNDNVKSHIIYISPRYYLCNTKYSTCKVTKARGLFEAQNCDIEWSCSISSNGNLSAVSAFFSVESQEIKES